MVSLRQKGIFRTFQFFKAFFITFKSEPYLYVIRNKIIETGQTYPSILTKLVLDLYLY